MTTTTQAPVPVPGSSAHTDGAWGLVPVQTRSERPRSFDPATFGVPTGHEVNWKLSPIDRIAPLFADAAGDPGAVTVEVTGPLAAAGLAIGQSPRGDVFEPEDLVSALAWQRSTEALFLDVPAEAELASPVEVVFGGTGTEGLAHAHVVIRAGRHARATVVLRHEGAVRFAQNVEIIVEEGAHLTVVSVQRWDDGAVHAAAHQARVGADAELTHVVVSLGGGVVRVNPSIDLAGTGSSGKVYGLAFADSGQHLESQVYVHHRGRQTTADVLYKSALQGQSARTVWVGDVLIGRDAVGTDSYEANRNLVLTDGARADSIPNLEIETGDIAGAGHASATGRFDDEQLFYLQARGIPESEARRLVVLGFLIDIIQRLDLPDLEVELTEAVIAELERGRAE